MRRLGLLLAALFLAAALAASAAAQVPIPPNPDLPPPEPAPPAAPAPAAAPTPAPAPAPQQVAPPEPQVTEPVEESGPTPEELGAQRAAEQAARERAARRAAAARRRAEERRAEAARRAQALAIAAGVSDRLSLAGDAVASGASQGTSALVTATRTEDRTDREGDVLRLSALVILLVAGVAGLSVVLVQRRSRDHGTPERMGNAILGRRGGRAALTVVACVSGALIAYLMVNPSTFG